MCDRWVYDPYFQHFTGEEFFQHSFPHERSDLSHWRQRLGDKLELLLAESLRVAHEAGALRTKDLKRVTGTHVQPKAISFPTDAKLLHAAISGLARLARKHGVKLRQSYQRIAKRAAMMAGRYAHAKQFNRHHRELRLLRSRLGRIIRDIGRKIEGQPALAEAFAAALSRASQIRSQQQRQRGWKLYSFHAPEAVCGLIGITQATADIYHVRVQLLDYLGGEPKGSMTMRGGKMQVVEYPPEYLAKNRRVIESDRDWLTANAEILPAIPKSDPPLAMRRMSAVPGARFFDDIFAASGSSRLLVSDDLFTRQAGNVLGVVSTSLQPVLMIARERGVLSPKDYARAISELIDMGQKSIGIDAAALMAARELDIDDGVNQVGPRLTKAAKALGGPSCDPASHCSVTAEFIITIWGNEPLRLDDYAVVSHVLSAVLRSRTGDYGGMLQLIDRLLGGNEAARRYLHEWARGHFLI